MVRRPQLYILALMLRSYEAKLQAQVARLREDIDMQRSHRQQMSDEVLAEARSRLEQLQQLVSSCPSHYVTPLTDQLKAIRK